MLHTKTRKASQTGRSEVTIGAMGDLAGNTRVVLGVSGGIAAYKAASLCRLLTAAGASVRVVMTRAACEFVRPLTFQALSGNPVHTDLLDPTAEAAMGHIELARWAGQILIAPASANLIARLAHGMADDLLSTLCLASEAPISLAPAMNRVMWANEATRANVSTLKDRGIRLLGPASGEQACGETGEGRMLEPEQILSMLAPETGDKGPLAGKRLVVTAGPTREAIDPVRFVGNRSSGKMGYAIAREAAAAGASVTLISGPVALPTPIGVERIDVENAEAMLKAALDRASEADVFIAVAAVADYRPVSVADHKIKKGAPTMHITLERTPDILSAIAALPDRPFCVGFAAETHKLADYAREKMARKGIDMIAANDVCHGKAFGQDDNTLHVFWSGGDRLLAQAPKQQLARQLIDLIGERLTEHHAKH